MRRALIIFSIILVLLLGLTLVWGKGPRGIHLPYELGALQDESGEMSIAQAASSQTAARYKTLHTNRMSFGFCRSPLWVRIPLEQAPATGRWVLEVSAPWMDRVDLYLPKPSGGWQKESTGLAQPLAYNRQGVFALKVPADTPRTGYAYLRLQSLLSLNAGLRIWPETAFEINNVTNTFFYDNLW